MGRKKNATSEMDVPEKLSAPLTQRLNELITDSNELKDFLGCSIQAINQYKLGISRPSLENLCKIADFYNVSTDYLLGRTEIKTSDTDLKSACEFFGLTEESAKMVLAYKNVFKTTKNTTIRGLAWLFNKVVSSGAFFHTLRMLSLLLQHHSVWCKKFTDDTPDGEIYNVCGMGISDKDLEDIRIRNTREYFNELVWEMMDIAETDEYVQMVKKCQSDE